MVLMTKSDLPLKLIGRGKVIPIDCVDRGDLNG